jgi:methionyl-tRNA formyltransferase
MSSGVALFGYGELAVAGLDALAAAGASLSAAVVPSNRIGSDVDRIRETAARRGLRVLVQPPRHDIGPFVETLRETGAGVIIVCSYSMILPASVLAVPVHGAVNVHGGLLPEYRGGHVAQWAIINGEREFGVTLHYMDDGIDTGPIIAERRFALDDADDAGSLRQKVRAAAVELLTHWWPRLADGTAPRTTQDPARARHWRMRTPEDGQLAWTMSTGAICRLVRALRCNSPGAYVSVGGRQMSIRQAEAHPPLANGAQPGRVVATDARGVRVTASDGDILISAAEIDGCPATAEEVAGLLMTWADV